MALVLGLVKPGCEQPVLESIISDLQKRDYQQTAGDVGYHYLVEALEGYGRSDIICRILNRYDIGSYGYIIKQGWTSMPEAWNAKLSSSMNHCMLGHVQQWFFQGVGGISSETPGFCTIKIRPEVVSDVSRCVCNYESIHGMISSRWQRNREGIKFFVTVPVNTSATVHLPDTHKETLYESGKPVSQAEGVRFLRKDPHRLVYELQSGEYEFRMKWKE
jgi:hypothetical protein